MNQITTITDDPNQTSGILLDDGSTVQVALSWIPAQQGWYISFTHGSFQVNLMRVVVSPNILRKYRRIISFGIAFTTTDGYEIVSQKDFVGGRASMYSLNAADVAQVETLITQTLPVQLGSFIS